MTGNFQFFTLQFTMNGSTIFCLVTIVSVANSLKLNLQRPSTVWGVQRKLLSQNLREEYYKSRDGTYHFKYDTGNGLNQMFRNERRFADGTVSGFFGYIDPVGILRITEYVAGPFGYRQRTIIRYPVQFLDK